MKKKITWLQFSDMHVFAQKAGNVAILQAYKKLAETISPDFVVVTGDFRHLGKNTTFEGAIEQLEKMLSVFGVGKQDVFLIPGNHDVGLAVDSETRSKWIEDIHDNIEKNYQSYAQYQDKLMDGFSDYRMMVKEFYKGVLDECDPRISKCDNVYYVCWNNRLNIVGMNTALISDGKRDHKEIFDADSLYSILDGTEFQQSLPTILLGHHSPNDFYDSQSIFWKTFLYRTNPSAYLHGDMHKLNIQDAIGSILVPERIPSVACGKSAPEVGDDYSDVSFVCYEWENDTVTVCPYVYGNFGGILQFKESDAYDTENGKFVFQVRELSIQKQTAKTSGKQLGAVVPFVHEEDFIGRSMDIGELQKLLRQPNAKIWLRAPGGIGKSTLARRLYYTVSDEFDRLIYVNYNTSLEESFVESVSRSFYDPYDTIPENTNSKARFIGIVEQLQNSEGKTLIIIDNVPGDSNTTASLYSLTGIPATILITARTEAATGYVDYHLESLDVESQKCVFLFHLGSTYVESTVLLQLLERCYGNTLLIELTAKAAKRRGCSKLLEALEVGGFEKEHTPVSSTDGRRSPIADHLRQLYTIADLDAESQRVLRCFALMPTGPVDDAVANWFGTDIRRLFDLSDMAWLKNKNGFFEMHPLIRETILLDKESFPEDTEAAFHSYFRNNYDDFLGISLDYPLRTRRIAIAARFLHRIACTIDYAEACHNLAIALQELCMYQPAESLMLVSLRIKKCKLGKNHLLTASAYHNLAMIYQYWNRPGDMDRAVKLHLKNLIIKIRRRYRYHPDTAISYNNLALVYQYRGKRWDLEKAGFLYKKALRIQESILGCDHLDTANTYNNIAYFYKCRNKRGDREKAEEYYLKAMKIEERILNGKNIHLAMTYNNLATLYLSRNQDDDLNKAEKLYFKALSIWEKKFGKVHPKIALVYCNLSAVYQERHQPGDCKQAELLLCDAINIFETTLGEDHPYAATAYNNLGSLYQENKLNLDEAERYLLKAKKICENVYGVQHPNTIKVYQRLMILYGERKQPGDHEKSLEYLYKSGTIKQLRKMSLLK